MTIVRSNAACILSFHGIDPRYTFLPTEERDIDDEDLAFLKNSRAFKHHLKSRDIEIPEFSRAVISEIIKAPIAKGVLPKKRPPTGKFEDFKRVSNRVDDEGNVYGQEKKVSAKTPKVTGFKPKTNITNIAP